MLPVLPVLGLTFQVADDVSTSASRLVATHGPSVAAVEVLEVNSSAKAASGSGFFVTDSGHLITNYHVVSQAILEPWRHTISIIPNLGVRTSARLVEVDVVNDLALLETDFAPPVTLSISPDAPGQGTRFYAFGFPGDLGLAVVDGTYNGYLEHTFNRRMHFTGALHPGMSGGPVVSDAGTVIGINVATSGDVSFLIPSNAALQLLETAERRGFTPSVNPVRAIGDQLTVFQDRYTAAVLGAESRTVTLDLYDVPTQPAAFFDCWGDTYTEDENRWEYIDHRCGVDDVMFISNDYRAQTLQIFHRVVRSERVNPFRFHRLLTESFRLNSFWTGGHRDDVTSYECYDDNVDVDGRVMTTVFCARRLLRFDGLYDVVFKVAAVTGGKSGLESTLQLSAVSFENAVRLADRYISMISWSP